MYICVYARPGQTWPGVARSDLARPGQAWSCFGKCILTLNILFCAGMPSQVWQHSSLAVLKPLTSRPNSMV